VAGAPTECPSSSDLRTLDSPQSVRINELLHRRSTRRALRIELVLRSAACHFKDRSVASNLPQKLIEQINKAGLPTTGTHAYQPKLTTNRQGLPVIQKKRVTTGPKRGKHGYVDDQGQIWIKDRAHAGLPDHWDVQLAGGEYIRVDMNGNELP
jgi:hypothetical protein